MPLNMRLLLASRGLCALVFSHALIAKQPQHPDNSIFQSLCTRTMPQNDILTQDELCLHRQMPRRSTPCLRLWMLAFSKRVDVDGLPCAGVFVSPYVAQHMSWFSVFFFPCCFSLHHVTNKPTTKSQWMAASLFFGYTFVMTACFFLLTGTVGYFSCQWFINVIYSSIKASISKRANEDHATFSFSTPVFLPDCLRRSAARSTHPRRKKVQGRPQQAAARGGGDFSRV